MYYIGEFCRVCLGADKPLVNILQNDLRQITLISKLELCVSEVVCKLLEVFSYYIN